MCDEEDGFVLQDPPNALLPNVKSHVRIHGTHDVIQQIHVGIRINGSAEGDPGLLSTTNVDATLSWGPTRQQQKGGASTKKEQSNEDRKTRNIGPIITKTKKQGI